MRPIVGDSSEAGPRVSSTVRVRELNPGQEIDQVLMVRASDARRVVLGDRTGTLEAAPCQIGAGSCVRVAGTVEPRGRLAVRSVRDATTGKFAAANPLPPQRIAVVSLLFLIDGQSRSADEPFHVTLLLTDDLGERHSTKVILH